MELTLEQDKEMNEVISCEITRIFPHIDTIPFTGQKRVIVKTIDTRQVNDSFEITDLMELTDLHVLEINKQIEVHKGKPSFVVFPTFSLSDYDKSTVSRRITSALYFDGDDLAETIQYIIEKRRKVITG